VCLLCAFVHHGNARQTERPSAAEVIDSFKHLPADEKLPERLRIAASYGQFWQVAVLMRLAAWRIEELTKAAAAKSSTAVSLVGQETAL
jgi:hypothetical protein